MDEMATSINTATPETVKRELSANVREFWYLNKESFRAYLNDNKDRVMEWTEDERSMIEDKCARMFGYSYTPPWRIKRAIWVVRFFRWFFSD